MVSGRGEPADADHRLGGQALDELDDKGSWKPSPLKRAVWPSLSTRRQVDVPQVRQLGQHRDDVRPSPRRGPAAPGGSSTPMRTATAQVSPTASLASSIISRSSRARFSRLPPYSSVRWLCRRRQEVRRQRHVVAGVDIDDVEAGPRGVDRRRGLCQRRRSRDVRTCPWPARSGPGRRAAGRRRGSARSGWPRGSPGSARGSRCAPAPPPARAPCAWMRSVSPGQGGDVVDRPTARSSRRCVARVVDLALLGGHHGPAALGLDLAHRGHRAGRQARPMPLQWGTW